MDLQGKIDRLYTDTKLSLSEYNKLLVETTDQREFAATVFIYDHMKNNAVEPTKETFQIIERLHSKTIPENKKIILKWDGKTRLTSRRRIHKIIKGHKYGDNYNEAKQYIGKVEEYLNKNPEVKSYARIKMARSISNNCNITFDEARYVITNLKRTKKIVSTDNANVNAKKLDGYFNITFS